MEMKNQTSALGPRLIFPSHSIQSCRCSMVHAVTSTMRRATVCKVPMSDIQICVQPTGPQKAFEIPSPKWYRRSPAWGHQNANEHEHGSKFHSLPSLISSTSYFKFDLASVCDCIQCCKLTSFTATTEGKSFCAHRVQYIAAKQDKTCSLNIHKSCITPA